jgi:hypothetical protein
MVNRLTAALALATVLALPGIAFAQGPPDKSLAQEIVNQIAAHNCEAAQLVGSLFGVKVKCPIKPPSK